MSIKRSEIGIALFWAIFLTAAVLAVRWVAVSTADYVVKLALGIVTAAGGILTAVVTHTLNRIREQEQEMLKRMQQNYAELVAKIAPFVRNPDDDRDAFAGAHLFSWVVASPQTVEKCRAFLDSQNDKPKALKNLLLQMRRDLGLDREELENLTLDGLFPPVVTKKKGEM
ncbi:MAG TPA: hypothetical protein VHW72_08840 [Candidatus Angelobacter sp.]|jgi:hypothetical protein|nr:hypothetical protein [Candidatus Angelobacter sp.]